jgi:hypothetical protein
MRKPLMTLMSANKKQISLLAFISVHQRFSSPSS